MWRSHAVPRSVPDVTTARACASRRSSQSAALSSGQTLALREPAAAEATGSPTARAARTYEVRRGDNLWQIARRFETSVEEIRRLNGIAAATALKPGDRLVLP